MQCIYCQEREADSEEHLLPRGLGRFPAPFLPAQGVLCHQCNVRFGNDLITPLLQKGFYSQAKRVVPWKIGRPTKKKRPQGAGYDMPFAELPNVEGKVLVDFDLGRRTARAARQLVFREAGGSMTPWPVADYIRTSEALAAAIQRSGHTRPLPSSSRMGRPWRSSSGSSATAPSTSPCGTRT